MDNIPTLFSSCEKAVKIPKILDIHLFFLYLFVINLFLKHLNQGDFAKRLLSKQYASPEANRETGKTDLTGNFLEFT
jgi:hypothetical protein